MVKRYKYTQIMKDYSGLQNRSVIIYGYSLNTLRAFQDLSNEGIRIIGFVDSFVKERGGVFCGLPFYTFEELNEMQDVCIYIATNNWEYKVQIMDKLAQLENVDVFAEGEIFGPGEYDTQYMREIIEANKNVIDYVANNLSDEKSKLVYRQLLEYRLTNDNKLLRDITDSEPEEYFPKEDFLKCSDNEVFIDAGAYNGDTAIGFARWSADTYSKIYCMEPDPIMYEVTRETVKFKNITKVSVINKGAWNTTGRISFTMDNTSGSSKIAESGTSVIETIAIDEMLNGEKATYIKMDIEGAEYEALLGCKKTIEKYRPKLAICIYHNEDDLWKLPYHIATNYPWYKLYIRHYGYYDGYYNPNETVLYAVE